MSMLVAENAVATVPARRSLVETFQYDNAIVRNFAVATAAWGLVAFLVGLIVALKLVFPGFLPDIPYLSYGRLRPLHTNAAIFAFGGNAIFVGVYYSLQRLCKARMFSDRLSAIHFWGWQLIIVAAALTLPLGLHHQQGIRGAGVADRSADHRRLGGVRREHVRHDPRGAASGTSTWRSGSTSRRSSPSRCCTSSTRSSCRSACSRATRSTPACRTRWCSGGTGTTRSRSS